MFTNFTWWQFLATFLLLLAIYYPLILSLYFRKEVALFWRKFVVSPLDTTASYEQTEEELSSTTNNYSKTSSESDATIAESITNLSEDIKIGIKAAADSHASKDQLFALLKNILAKYPQLKKAGQQVQINEFIIQECARSNYTLHMAQVYALWANAADTNE